MNVNGISKQAYYENNNGVKTNNKKNGTGFYESLSENINGRNEKANKNAATNRGAMAVAAPYTYRNVRSVENYNGEIAGINSVSVCEARQLTYDESDYVKVLVQEGYSLMAQVDMDKRSIYIERKAEDGSLSGYEVEFDKIAGDTQNPIELAALEAWGKALLEKKVAGTSETSEEEALTVDEALRQFYDFIQDRIKNGPPKYMIGNSEFSQDEWKKLLASIDEQLDDARDEVEERIKKMEAMQFAAELEKEKEEQNAAKNSSKQYISAEEIAGLDSEELEEKALLRGRGDMDGVPYGYLAKDGIIEYKGVVFVCDKEHKAIHLGDTSDKNKCIRIPLSKGGCLIVNRDNLGDLATAIGMFSPEDVNLIMRAIAEDAKIQQMKQQIDEDESGIGLVEDVEEAEAELIEEVQNLGSMADSFENKEQK